MRAKLAIGLGLALVGIVTAVLADPMLRASAQSALVNLLPHEGGASVPEMACGCEEK